MRPSTARRSTLMLWAAVLLAAPVLPAQSPGAQALRGACESAGPAPQRIISVVPAVTEMLFQIGAGARVVAVSSFDDHPPEVARLPRVGALLDPDLEAILGLRPDLVVAYGSQTDLQQQLARAGIATFVYAHGGLADVGDTMRALGRCTGDERKAAEEADRLERNLQWVREALRGATPHRTLLVFGRDRQQLRGIYASGGVGFLHDLLELTGGVNVLADVTQQSIQVSLETILSRAPDVIVELRYAEGIDAETAAREADAWKRLASLPAVRSGRVHVLVGDEFVVPGPRIADAARVMARTLHPEAFKP